MELGPGAVLVGRYRIDRKLGSGGMADVWAAKNIAVGTEVAVKTLSLSASADAEIVMRFRREAYLLACVRSDHVTRILDFASDATYGHLLVTDLIHGDVLLDVIKARTLTVEQGLDLANDLARGLIDLHRAKVVHRDLKPGNIMLERRHEGRFRAVIVDFGLGRILHEETSSGGEISAITNVDTALGTMEYVAPEQILNSRGAAPTADIYSLGAILYTSVSGRHMFGALEGPGLAQAKITGSVTPMVFTTGRNDRLARGFEAIVNRAIMRHPEARYQRAEELLADLSALYTRRREDAADGARPVSMPDLRSSMPSMPPGAGARASQHRTHEKEKGSGIGPVVVFLTAFVAMIVGAALGWTMHRDRGPDPKDCDGVHAPTRNP